METPGPTLTNAPIDPHERDGFVKRSWPLAHFPPKITELFAGLIRPLPRVLDLDSALS